MSFTEIFIRRPVFASVLSLLLFLIGLLAYQKLTIRQFPEVSASVINITTTYAGANADLMESFVATPIESAVTSVKGLDFIESKSTSNVATISLHFKLGYDVSTAAADVREKVSSIRGTLPTGIKDPIIEKQDPNVTPIQYIAFASDSLESTQITDYLQRVIKPNLETIEGVGEAKMFGGHRYAMRIWLNPNLMANHNVTTTDVVSAIQANNPQSAAGRIESGLDEYDVQAKTDLTTANEFNQLVIKQNGDYLTRLNDVGNAKLGSANDRVSVNMNGKRAIVIGIIARSTANPLAIAKQVREKLANFNKTMPSDLKAKIVWDSSKFIAASIHEVTNTIIEATLFVIIVILLFLGSLRILAIPIITIPLSLIGICFFMYLMGFTLNTLTFLAMVLAIGLVVDDAIVVAENIHRHIESGLPPLEAAIKGSNEIQFAIIAMTLTLAAVFAPIGFMEGLTGIFFKEFAFALAGTVLVSGFIALTLTPMMCSKIMKKEAMSGKFANIIDKISHGLAARYRGSLTRILSIRMIILGSTIVVFSSCYFLFSKLPTELAPAEDTGAILSIVSAPASANLSYTEKYTQQLSNILQEIPEYESFGIINGFSGVNSAISFLMLKPWEERTRNVNQIIASLFPKFFQLTGVQAFPVNPFSLPGAEGLMPLSFVIQTTGDYSQLYNTTQQLMGLMRQNPAIVNVDTDLKIDKPEFVVDINRNMAGLLGVSMQDIGLTLNLALGEPDISRFSLNGENYDVIPGLAPQFQRTAEALKNLHVRAKNGDLIPLTNLVTIHQKTIPRSLNHFQQLRSATITGAMTPGYTLGQALNYLDTTVAPLLGPDTSIDYSGISRQFKNNASSMEILFFAAILFIYLMLAAQFESFIDPFTVMVSVPLSLTGAIFVLYLKGYSLNIYTQIGLVTLIGLISKHGILIVEFANQLQIAGKSVNEAVIEAATIRLRPILMTTAAILLGSVPLAFAGGAGAISRQQIGWTILGGMSFGTLMTLYVVPVVYTTLSKKNSEAKVT